MNVEHRFKIGRDSSLVFALKQMDANKSKLLIVVDEHGFYSTLISIGDIQRAIINGVSLSSSIASISIDKKIVASVADSKESIITTMKRLRSEFMPVVDNDGAIKKILFWNDIFDQSVNTKSKKHDLPVVIMAGGKGTRLRPLSNILPKPLTPIGEKTILEEIMARFRVAGSEKFYLSVNYKKEMIEYYLKSTGLENDIELFEEDSPLGTAGSLSLLKGKIAKTFYVTNCDILIDQDLSELYEYHSANKNEITLVSAIKHLSIPYGTITSGKDGLLDSMEEKPDLTFKVNAGVYILEPHLLNEIPENEFFHITELIHRIKERNGRVGVFPISEKSWLDIGEWPKYIKTVRALSDENQFHGL